jgi:hypothetical protein
MGARLDLRKCLWSGSLGTDALSSSVILRELCDASGSGALVRRKNLQSILNIVASEKHRVRSAMLDCQESQDSRPSRHRRHFHALQIGRGRTLDVPRRSRRRTGTCRWPAPRGHSASGSESGADTARAADLSCRAGLAYAVQKPDGKRIVGNLIVPSPRSKIHPVIVPRAVLCSQLPDGVGWLKVTMFPGAVGIDLVSRWQRT